MVIEEFTVTLKYRTTVDTTTGEIQTECIKKTIDNSKVTPKTNVSPGVPKLILESNKYCLTQAAADLLGVVPDDKVDIKYEKYNGRIVPIIASDTTFNTKGGNRLTKSLTVACRGVKNAELSKYGDEFLLVKHSTKDGIFILDNGKAKEDTVEENSEDFDLSDLIGDTEITEVSASMFKL